MNNLVSFKNDRITAEVSIRLREDKSEYKDETKLHEVEKILIGKILVEADAYSSQCNSTILPARKNGCSAIMVILENEDYLSNEQERQEWKQKAYHVLRNLVCIVGYHAETIFFNDGTSAVIS